MTTAGDDPRVTLKLTPKQSQFYGLTLEDKVPNTSYIGGLGSGKTVAGTAVTLTLLERFPGMRILLLGPVFDQLSQGTIQTFLEWCPHNYIQHHYRSQEHRIEFVWRDANGTPSELLYRSTTEPERIRAHEYGAVWWDEQAYSPETSLQVVRGRLRSFRGGLPKNWHFPIYGTTTPRGRNWLWKMFGPERVDRKRFRMVHATTYDNAANLPAEYINLQEAALAGNESLRQQELEGLFVSLEGLVWPMFDERKHMVTDPVPWDDPHVRRRVAGVDFGGGDPTAIVVLGIGGSGRMHVYEEEIWDKPVGLEVIGSWLMERHGEHPFEAVWCDPSNQTAIQTLRAAGLPAGPIQGQTSARSINDRIEGRRLVGSLFSLMQLTLSSSLVHLPAHILSYVLREKQTPDGTQYYTSTPVDHHADLPDALRYAIMGSRITRQIGGGVRRRRRRSMAAA